MVYRGSQSITREYKIMTQFNSPKDINVTVGNSLWPGVPGLPDAVTGKVLQWANKERITLRINWLEPDGTWKYDRADQERIVGVWGARRRERSALPAK